MKPNWEIKPMLSSLIYICFSHIQVTKEKSFPKSMNETNHSQVTEFVLLGLSNSQELQPFLFLIFSLLYLAILLGNFLIILTVTSDPCLHTPMYFLLANLSFIDICYLLLVCSAYTKCWQQYNTFAALLGPYSCLPYFLDGKLAHRDGRGLLPVWTFDKE